MPRRPMPLDAVEWVDPSTLHANSYNPNRCFTPEMELLKLSILEDGWTQPIVAREDNEIVDGFHRWTLGMKDPEIRAASDNQVPVVRLRNKALSDQMLSTIRHNRARGQHGILKMGEIITTLREEGLPDEEIERRLGMEQEEVERLGDMRGSPDAAGADSFGAGWVPMSEAERAANEVGQPAAPTGRRKKGQAPPA